jgi:hypothetical protein
MEKNGEESRGEDQQTRQKKDEMHRNGKETGTDILYEEAAKRSREQNWNWRNLT